MYCRVATAPETDHPGTWPPDKLINFTKTPTPQSAPVFPCTVQTQIPGYIHYSQSDLEKPRLDSSDGKCQPQQS